MKAAQLALACIAASSALCGCAPYLSSCRWAIPEAGRSVEVVGKRVPTAGECECLRCAAPGDFKLRRDRYTLEFWNGDRRYPELHVRARTENGERLFLYSAQLLPLTKSTGSGREKDFEYWVRLEGESAGETAKPVLLTVTIKSEDGTVLGVEDLALRIEYRRDSRIETI
jgi:hypothetical protein